MDPSEIIARRVVYSFPGMEKAQVRPDIVYKSVEGVALRLDAYYPPEFAYNKALPAVLFIHGDGPVEVIKNVKSWGQYISWGQLVAACGLIGIPFEHRSSRGRIAGMEAVDADIHDLIDYVRAHAAELHIDPCSLCVWACSAGVPYLQELMATPPDYVRGLVAYYGMMDFRQFTDSISRETPAEERAATVQLFKKFSLLKHLQDHPTTIPPLFIAQASLDDPVANDTINRFVAAASARGAGVESVRHPNGQHGFDIVDDDETSRKIIEQTLRFINNSTRINANWTD